MVGASGSHLGCGDKWQEFIKHLSNWITVRPTVLRRDRKTQGSFLEGPREFYLGQVLGEGEVVGQS